MRAMDGGDSLRRNAKKALRTSAAFRCRVSNAGLDVTLLLQAIKRCIDGANRDFPLDAGFDFLAHGDAVGAVIETQNRQKDNVFEFSEVVPTRHYLYIIE